MEKQVRKASSRLFADPHDQERFEAALCTPREMERGVVWVRPPQGAYPSLQRDSRLPINLEFVTRSDPGVEIGKLQPHLDGSIYALDISSVVFTSLVQDTPTQPQVVLDLCSAPGGKGITVWRMLSPELLLCNEVVRKRIGMLISNLKRCGVGPAAVMSFDAATIGNRFPRTFPVTIVDAPCSGQSLLAKGEQSPGCFHRSVVNLNVNRQRKILSGIIPAVAPDGFLLYVTCTYSREENEGIIDWLIRKHPHFEPVTIPALQHFRSPYSPHPAYRIWPWQDLGAGGFACLMRNKDTGRATEFPVSELKFPWKSW